MLHPIYTFACLTEALILFPASTLTLKKLYKGSKSNFAYLLTTFTFADVLCRLATVIYN
jgi:hypothetical protein